MSVRPPAADPFLAAAPRLARALIGACLVHDVPGGERLVGRIVETEAYLHTNDAASHSRSGPTRRNASMFLAGGHAYVYRIYGLHRCFNVVAGPAGRGEAVLVRALEPLEGLETMRARRGTARDRDLCRGPARLVEAFAIGAHHDGADLRTGPLRIVWPKRRPVASIAKGVRVGLGRGATDALGLELRFGLAQSAWVSRPFPTDAPRRVRR